MFVHPLSATPPPRYDGAPWTRVRFEESADNVAFAAIDEQDLDAPLDPDPGRPALRRLTTSLATLAQGYYRVVWIDGVGNESPPSPSTFAPGAAEDGYPSRDELLAASSVDELTSLEQARQAELRRSAISAVELFCRQSFTQEGTALAPVTRTLDGTGTGRLDLPKRLASLTQLLVFDAAVASGDWILDEAGEYVELVNPVGSTWLTRVRRDAWESEPVFERGRGSVAVSGVWGWTDEEWAAGRLDPVREAIRLDMEDQALSEANRLAETVRSARALGVSSLTQGGLSYAIREREPTLSARVRRKLYGLRWRGPIGVVV